MQWAPRYDIALAMRALIIGLIGGGIAALLGWLARRQQGRARVDQAGWKSLRPGWFLHGVLIGCLAFFCLMAYFLARGGSALSDAAMQNFSAILIMAVSGLCAAYIGWVVYGQSIAWKGRQLRLRKPFGGQSLHRFTDISSLRISAARGECRIQFADGTALVFSTYMHGARELLRALPQMKA